MEDLKKMHHWEILAISCIDGRFIKRTIEWLTEQTGGVFDYRTEVGMTKAIIDCDSDRNACCGVIETSLRLHSIEGLYLIDHIDCGAYGGSKNFSSAEDERKFHIERLKKAAEILSKKYPHLAIKKIFVDWETIEEV